MIEFVRCIPCGSTKVRIEVREPAPSAPEPRLRFLHVRCGGCGRTSTIRNDKGRIIEELGEVPKSVEPPAVLIGAST